MWYSSLYFMESISLSGWAKKGGGTRKGVFVGTCLAGVGHGFNRLKQASSEMLPPLLLYPYPLRARFSLKLHGHIEFIKLNIDCYRGLFGKDNLYGYFWFLACAVSKDANWRETGGSDGSLGRALPSRFATTFSHAVTIFSQVERQESVSGVFR